MKLGDMLRRNTSLLVLDIASTKCGIKGIISVCTAMSEVNRRIEYLDLGNPIINNPQVSVTRIQNAVGNPWNAYFKTGSVCKYLHT